MIYVHAFNLETYHIFDDAIGMGKIAFWVETAVATLDKFAVPVFFMISGFLFFRSFSVNLLRKKLQSRVKTILMPYFIWCSLYYIAFAVCESIPFIRTALNRTSNGGASLYGWIKSLWVEEYYTLWFLKNLILFIALSPIFFLLLKNHKRLHNGTIVMLIICAISLTEIGKKNPISGLPEYMLGCYIGLNFKEIVAWRAPKILSYSAIFALPSILVVSFFSFNLIVKALFLTLFWVGLDVFCKIKVHWWMTITFFTYVAHDFLLEAIEKMIYISLPKTPTVALLDFFLTPVIVEMVLIAAAYFLICKMPTLWNILSGWRKVNIARDNQEIDSDRKRLMI